LTRTQLRGVKFFRENGLFPTPDHKIYSFRHTFEDRLKEAGIDDELWRLLMGHAIDRSEYALADRSNGVRAKCGKSSWTLTRQSSDSCSDARHTILSGLERLQFRL
jgi:hypothetical protein